MLQAMRDSHPALGLTQNQLDPVLDGLDGAGEY
jgi:hypothetical protein